MRRHRCASAGLTRILCASLLAIACGAPEGRGSAPELDEPTEATSPRALLEHAEREAQAAEAACVDGSDHCPDYGAAIEALVRLIREHPGSDEAAAALEPLGFFLHSEGRTEEAAHAWLSAVCPARVPDPLGVPGDPPSDEDLTACEPRRMSSLRTFLVWFRLGSQYFDETDLGRARATLARAVAIAPDDPRYGEAARYKLAWTLYRMDRYADALEAFAPLAGSATVLRDEALQYMAIILTEPDWDSDGADDAVHGLARAEVRAWIEDWEHAPALVLEASDALFDMARYAETIAACERFLARWPNDLRAADARALRDRAGALLAGGQRK